MKKLFTALVCTGLVGSAYAYQEVTESINQSSFTTTGDTIRLVCPTCSPGTELFDISVASATQGVNCNIYDSSATTVGASSITIVNLGVVQNDFFNIRVSSGLSYSCSGANNGFSIIYRLRHS